MINQVAGGRRRGFITARRRPRRPSTGMISTPAGLVDGQLMIHRRGLHVTLAAKRPAKRSPRGLRGTTHRPPQTSCAGVGGGGRLAGLSTQGRRSLDGAVGRAGCPSPRSSRADDQRARRSQTPARARARRQARPKAARCRCHGHAWFRRRLSNGAGEAVGGQGAAHRLQGSSLSYDAFGLSAKPLPETPPT